MNNIYSEILIDHTSLHSLQKKKTEAQNLMPRTRELFKFIENILLSDVVWICDTVTPKTMSITEGFIELFLKHGLAHSRADGKFRVGKFTGNQIRKACEDASNDVYQTVSQFNIQQLRDSTDKNIYQLRPDGAQKMDFEKVAKMPFDSDQANEYIQNCLIDLGWGPSSCLPLLNPDLFTWFSTISSQASSNSDKAYTQFNTICRWKFNEELAKLLSIKSHEVLYVPSYGRSQSLLSLNKYEWEVRLEKLEKTINKAVQENNATRSFFRNVGTSIDFPLPVLGMWIISKLPPNPTFGNLLDKIAEYQNSDLITQLKSHIFSDSVTDYELVRIQKEISNELKISQKKHSTGNEIAIEAVVKIPIVPTVLDFQLKGSKKYQISNGKKLFRDLFVNHKLTTLLTGFIEDIVPTDKVSQDVFSKAKYILCK